jgi:cytidylate kinase
MTKEKVIAIDGPSGSGKSTIAKIVSNKLSLTYLDTGAMFRAIGYSIRKLDIDFSKNELTKSESESVQNLLDSLKFEYGVDDKTLIRVNDEDLSEKIREHEISTLASLTSKFSPVRNYLKSIQRDIAILKPSVLEGRDIGTVIFPNAAVKIFLTADPEVRAERRYSQLIEKDESNRDKYSVGKIMKDIEERDAQDANRSIAPLTKASDAIEIDTSYLSIEEVAESIIEAYNNKKELFLD